MPSKASPKAVATFLLLLLLLAVVAVIQLRPSLLPGGMGDGKAPQVGTYKVPKLDPLPGDQAVQGDGATPRNLFAFGAPPTPTPDLRPTPTPRPTSPPPPPPPPTPTPRWPPPPAFTMAYMGWLGPDRLPVAVFRDGEEIVAVPQGEIVKQKFIVRKVDLQEVTIGFVGWPEMATTKVPLAK